MRTVDGRTFLRGTETATVELEGIAPPEIAARVASPLAPDLAASGVRVSVLFFAIRGLGLARVPGVGLSYREALFRIGAAIEGAPAWLAVACAIDRPLARAAGRLVVRYPVRRAAITIRAGECAVRAREGELVLRLADGPRSTVESPRRAFTVSGGRLYEIPWEEEPPEEVREARVEVTRDTLSLSTFGAAVTWETARVHGGRVHMCGRAHAFA